MFHLKKLIQAVVLVSLSSAALGMTAFSIAPFTTSATVQSGSQTSVLYTVTNNATAQSIPDLSVLPNWQSAGKGFSLRNDGCSGQTLAHGASCTFDIVIPGSNQPNYFLLQPKVCGFNGLLCSQATNTVSVNVQQHLLPFRTYEVVFPQDSSSEELIGINISNTSDVIRATLSSPSTDGPLVVSHDGSKVYMTHSNGDGTYSLLVFAVTANSLSQTDVSYSLSYGGHDLNNLGQLALTPDGQTLYITNNGYTGSGYPVYKIDLTDTDYSTAVTGISDATVGNLVNSPKGIVVSPDDQTVYFANANSGENDIFSFPNASTTTSVSTVVKETDMSSIISLLISSDGSSLYASGQFGFSSLPAVIEQYNVANSFALENTFSPLPDDNGNVLSAGLSPNDANIYSIVNDTGTFLLYTVNTADMSAPAGTVYPYHIVFGLGNFNYISASPDGSAVSILNYGASGNLTALFNPSTPESVTTVNPSSSEVSMYSHTLGAFIG